MKQVSIQLAQYKPIATWQPQIGDFVIQHGLLTHWFGIVNAISNGTVTITKAGLPVLLFTMDELDIDKNKIILSISRIRQSGSGKYAVQQISGNQTIWYI